MKLIKDIGEDSSFYIFVDKIVDILDILDTLLTT